MAQKIASELVLTQDVYKDKDYSSITELSKAMQTEAKWLSPVVTWMSFTDIKYYMKKNYPLLYATEGSGNLQSLEKLDNANFEYKYSVIGRIKKTSIVVKSIYGANDKVGIGGTPFEVVFADRQFFRNQTVYPYGSNNSKLQCRVISNPTKVAGGYKYTLKIFESKMNLFLPLTSLVNGVVWSGGLPKVGFEKSDGVESRSQLPSFATNMVTTTRNTYKYAGNVDKKVMKFSIPIEGQGTFTTYMDWELFLTKISFKQDQEEDLIWSRYGKASTGDFYNLDEETEAFITSGAGIDQQIPSSNSDTYSFLTLSKWNNIIRQVTIGINDDITEMHVYTGIGGMQAFDDAVKAGLATQVNFVSDQKFVKGENSWDLQFGAYFNRYKFIDGQTIIVHRHPLLDYGARAKSSPVHPISGLPMTSHNYYFIDQSMVNGKSNIAYVSEDGREKMKIIQGMTGTPVGYPDETSVASSRDETKIEWMKSHGILIRRPSSCFKLECTLAGF